MGVDFPHSLRVMNIERCLREYLRKEKKKGEEEEERLSTLKSEATGSTQRLRFSSQPQRDIGRGM